MTYAFTFAALHPGRAGKHQGQEGFGSKDGGPRNLKVGVPIAQARYFSPFSFLSFQHIWAKPSLCSHTSLRNTDTWFGHWADEETEPGRWEKIPELGEEETGPAQTVPWFLGRAHSMPPERGGA